MHSSLDKHLYEINYTGFFTSDNDSDGTENATHNTLPKKKPDIKIKISGFFDGVLWVVFSMPLSSLSLVKYSV
jgi:hypothetical protein